MEYTKGLMDVPFTHIQIPLNEGWFMGENLLLFFFIEAQVVMGKLILVLHYMSQGLHLHAYENFELQQHFQI